MGCRSDYMEPNHRERLLQETAQLYGYVLVETGQRVPGAVADATNNIYCRTDFVSHLCEQLTNMDVDTRHRIVYNAYDKRSRQLADWWERHQAADKARIQKETQERQEKELLTAALQKLTREEISAIRKWMK